MVSRLVLLVGLSFGLCGCALPAWEQKEQGFIQPAELKAVALTRAGLNFAKRSRLIDAELRLRQALYIFPQAKNLSLDLAVVLDRRGLSEEAIAIYNELLQLEPDSVRFISSLARAYNNSGQYNLALNYWLKALELSSAAGNVNQTAQIARSLAVTYFNIGLESEAICYSNLAYALRSSADEAIRTARLLVATHHYDRAASFLTSALTPAEIDNQSEAKEILAVLAFNKGDVQGAKDAVAQLLEFDSIEPDATFELGLLNQVLTSSDSTQSAPDSEQQPGSAESKLASREELLLDPRLGGPLTLYWPIGFIEATLSLRSDPQPS